MRYCAREESPFEVLQRSVDVLVQGPAPPALPTADIDAVEGAEIPAHELMMLLRTREVKLADVLWRRVLARVRAENANWTVIAAGALLPRLVIGCARFGRVPQGRVADVEAEMLTALLEAMRTIDLAQRDVGSRLWQAAANTACRWGYYARRDGWRLAERASLDRSVPESAVNARGPVSVLAEAITTGVLTETEAELIARTRLESHTLGQVAADLGLTYITARRWRVAAEERLTRTITTKKFATAVSANAA